MSSPEQPLVIQGTSITPLPPARCCKVGCDRLADWQICWGDSPDDYTEACGEHVGDLLEPDAENRIYPLGGDEISIYVSHGDARVIA